MALKAVLLFQAILVLLLWPCECKTRVYYIGAVDSLWDYAPSGLNMKTGRPLNQDPKASVFTMKSKDRIGKVYKKTVYREFTDKTFTERKPHRKDLGILGPVIRGEVGDVLLIVFKNMAQLNFTMHPHGLSYLKSSEGSVYKDNTMNGMDRAVPPGATYIYTWKINPENGPTKGDQPCIASVYHSHVAVPHDINTGLIGLLLVCKKGSYDKPPEREMFLMQNVFDENKSWYIDENLILNNIDPKTIDKEDEDFMESNLMHAVNGRFFGNLEELNVCYNKKVVWYLGVLGNEVDMHTAVFNGNMLQIDHHHTDFVSLFPARTASGIMVPNQPGRWLFSCNVADHLDGGMFAFYNVKRCGYNGKINKPSVTGKVKEYYIAVEEQPWSYAETNNNMFDGGSLNSGSASTFFERGTNRIGGTYLKARYVQYEDSTFTRKKLRSPGKIHLGLLGPVIKAEVGDIISVVFRNKASRAYSIHPRGVWYDKANEGYGYKDKTTTKKDDVVYPGAQYTYQWFVDESVGPTAKDPPCVARLYTSNVNPVKDMYSGLMGPLVICKKGSIEPDGMPKGYDAEKFLLMAVMDENKSWYLDDNMKKYCTSDSCGGVSKEDEDFMESNKMHQINGKMYGNLQGLKFCKNSKILWHVFVVGTETDIHAVYFHGNEFEIEGNHKDSLTLFPGASASFSMMTDNIGKWALVCKVNDHYMAGMKAFYDVLPCGKFENSLPKAAAIRKYYIGAMEIKWDYAENGQNLIKGGRLDDDENAAVFTKKGPNRIGRVYKKAVYREFTDANFTRLKERTEKDVHLGTLGPIIRAEEGDEIIVVFKNMASRDYSIQAHGVFYDKNNEGSVYMDQSRTQKSRAVKPGSQHTYRWFVSKSSAPGPNDGPCITWSYFSGVDIIKDTNTGLVGPLITCKKGILGRDGQRTDVDKEFALIFSVFDENESWYLKDNILKFAGDPQSIDTGDEDFKESNKMHVINGHLFGNGPNNGNYLTMQVGDRVAWYLIGFGNEVDIHTVHFHANDFIHRTNTEHRDNTYNVFPGVFETLEMVPKHKGTWLLHCHVHDHLEGGMETRYTVHERKSVSLCRDKFSFCKDLKSTCVHKWVKRNCRRSCMQCNERTVREKPEPVQCIDRLETCSRWAAIGYCKTKLSSFKRFMERVCRKVATLIARNSFLTDQTDFVLLVRVNS
ncbi:hephaestin-like protein [Rhopilema esculentum]|uniref:hephaestin-like protein n=1 Tax=Rhopilema esculentum TaxID=499914 RepID=UPI0031CF0DA6